LLIVFVCVRRSLTILWKICLYPFGVWILRSVLLRSTTLNPMDHLEHLIYKVNWVDFEINSLVELVQTGWTGFDTGWTGFTQFVSSFVEKVLTCLFTPPLGNFHGSRSCLGGSPGASTKACYRGSACPIFWRQAPILCITIIYAILLHLMFVGLYCALKCRSCLEP
jgi:hypothetical protein